MNKLLITSICMTLSLPVLAKEEVKLSTGMTIEKYEFKHSQVKPMIIDGVNANFEEHPHYVAMTVIPDEWISESGGFSYMKNCGGSILNDRFILTAAHCVEDSVYTEINELTVAWNKQNPNIPVANSTWRNSYVVVASPDMSSVSSSSKFYRVKERHIPTGYGTEGFNGFEKYDIAILELEEAITHNVGSINHKDLNPSVYDQLDEWHATGMGKTIANDDSSASNILLTTKINPGNDISGYCKDRYSPETTICSEDSIEGFGATCQGDSGGPITYIDNGKHVQIGIVSYGSVPCGEGVSVYTEIAAYESWIDGIVTHGNELTYIPTGSGGSDIDDGSDSDTDADNPDDGSDNNPDDGSDNDSDTGTDSGSGDNNETETEEDTVQDNKSSGGDSGGSTGLLTLLGLGLFARRRN